LPLREGSLKKSLTGAYALKTGALETAKGGACYEFEA
jgi:hypothetical protein